MSRLFKGVSAAGSCLLLACICVSLISLRSCGSIGWRWEEEPDPTPGPGPGTGTCDNVGVVYSDNPFSGWPQAGRNRDDINYFYCDPVYYQEFGKTHWGIDIDAYHRETLYATGYATVAWAYEDPRWGMGRTVKICASNGWCATYMHLDEWLVAAGDTVSPGTPIGRADNTGFSTGTHLHYQIDHADGHPVDPSPTLD